MKTVYVEITDNYSRTVWDNTGATNYVIGDRVEYNDGSQNIVFVCITDNNSTATPDINTSDWVEAGSEEYPFLVSDAISVTNFCNLDDTTSTIGEYALYSSGTNFAVEAAGSQGEIILGDGEYRWTRTKGASYIHPNFNNVNIKAKNQLKAYIRGHFTRYNNCARVENLVLVNEYNPWNFVFGSYSNTPIYLIGCLITQETPTFKLASVKEEPSSHSESRPIILLAGGSIIRNCTFDFSYRAPSNWFNLDEPCLIENNTFYARVKASNYSPIAADAGSIYKNNIFYYKYLSDSHPDQNFNIGNIVTQGTNILYVENPVSASGGSIVNNIPDGQTINPLFIDADNGNFSLRPISPLIGGLKSENVLSDKYPEGMWFDANHIPVSQTYNFSLDSGDGSNYTFSGDAVGTDPAIAAGTGDTLVFTNNTGGHPIGIEDPNGNVIATESNGTLSFSTLTEGTYRYVCQAPHPNMSNTITITRNVGSYDNPSNDFIAALGVSYTLLIKEGTHALTRKIINMPGADLKIIGESTEKSVLVFSGGNYGGAISSAYVGDSSSLSFESLTFLWDGTQNAYGIILCNDLNVKSCIFAQTENHLNSASYTRGWFAGPNNAGKTAVIENSIIRGKSNNALVFGGDYQQNSFNKATISNCTIICDGVVTANFYGAGNSVGLANAQYFSLKNTLHVGFSGTELLNSSAPTSGGNNYYYNTGLSTGVIDGDLVSTEPPGFVSENDLRLRPNSRLIGGLSDPFSTVIWVSNTAGAGGSGSYLDPFNFGSLADAIIAAGPNGDIVFKNGSYASTSLGDFVFNDVLITTNQVNFYAETPGEVEFITTGQIKFGDSTFSPSSAATYNNLIFTSTNTGNDIITFNQLNTDTSIKHSFFGCKFKANIFMENIGTSTSLRVKFTGCTFSYTGTNYGFEQRNGVSGSTIVVFKNCLIHNYEASSAGIKTATLRRCGNLTLDSTIVVDYFNLHTDVSIAHFSLNIINSNFTHGNGAKIGNDPGNLGLDPKFIAPSKGNFSLRPDSPLIGMGR